MADVLAPPVVLVPTGAPPFVQALNAPPFVVYTGGAPNVGFPITVVQSGAPPITLLNADGTLWGTGGASLLTNEANGFGVDFLAAIDAKRVAKKVANVVTEYGVDSFLTNSSTSPKQVYDVTGTLVWAPHNRVLQSSAFDNASWTKTGCTVTANATAAPDGTATADKMVQDSSAGQHHLLQTIAATTGVLSVYAKAAESTKVMLYDGTVGKGNGFDLSAGTAFNAPGITPTGGAVISAVGNGWYRCSIPLAASATQIRYYILDAAGNFSFTGDGVSGVYFWGGQVENNSSPGAYIPTTTAARYGVPIDYDPLSRVSLGMLQEPAATNFLLRSTEFDNASWTKSAALVTANAAVAPNGLTEADKLIADTSAGVHCVVQSIPSTTGTFSVYCKAGEITKVMLSDVSNGKSDGFDLVNGVTFAASGGYTPSGGAVIRNVGNGWYRCSMPLAASVQPRIYTVGDNGNPTLTGDGVSGLYLWGAQAEATNTVATSFIPTFGATVTRPADNINFTPASINYSATAGSWWAEHYFKETLVSARVVGWQPGACTPICTGSSTAMQMFDATSLTSISTAWTGFVKRTASAYASGDRAISYGGLVYSADAGSTVGLLAPTPSIYFGSNNGGSSIHGYVRKVTYVPRRMTNAELQAKSA